MMTNIMNDLPLNTKCVYVMATDKTGCQVYIPVDSSDEKQQLKKRDEYQQFLNDQPPIPKSVG